LFSAIGADAVGKRVAPRTFRIEQSTQLAARRTPQVNHANAIGRLKYNSIL
jgi:hypothetical protein